MNIAYFIYHGGIVEWDLFDTCIKSLQKVSDCEIVVYTPELKNYQYLEKQNVKIVHFKSGAAHKTIDEAIHKRIYERGFGEKVKKYV